MPNIYMGLNSQAKIQAQGKVNTDKEILANTYSTAYDSINQWMLSKTGKLEKTTDSEIRGRFLVLQLLCKKYAPNKKNFIFTIEKLALANNKGQISDKQYLNNLRFLARQEGLPTSVLDRIEYKIDTAEKLSKNNFVKSMPIIPILKKTTKNQDFFNNLTLVPKNSLNTKNNNILNVKNFVSPQKQAALFAPNFLSLKKNQNGQKNQKVFPLHPFFQKTKLTQQKQVFPNLALTSFLSNKQKKQVNIFQSKLSKKPLVKFNFYPKETTGNIFLKNFFRGKKNGKTNRLF